MKKRHVALTDIDREFLEALMSKGELPARIYKRALGLLELDRGQTYTAVSKTLQMSLQTISKRAAKYRMHETGGSLRSLGNLVSFRASTLHRSGRPDVLDGPRLLQETRRVA